MALTIVLSQEECAALREAILDYGARHPAKATVLQHLYWAAESKGEEARSDLYDDLDCEARAIASAVAGLGDRHATLIARSGQ